jgi:hypothetical protein
MSITATAGDTDLYIRQDRYHVQFAADSSVPRPPAEACGNSAHQNSHQDLPPKEQGERWTAAAGRG